MSEYYTANANNAYVYIPNKRNVWVLLMYIT